MSVENDALEEIINRAVEAGDLLNSSAQNIFALLRSAPLPPYEQTLTELVQAGEWAELNDRFFRTLAFGTGGLRGRTIGKIVTNAERGTAGENEPPEFPCVGTNAMNFYNVSRATQGLVAYLQAWRAEQKMGGKPKIVIACDTRHYSKQFAELVARTAAENGCDAAVFEGPRSTPQLSFAVRFLGASAGIVITASHNPPHDNGFKAYFSDGAQVIEPQASAIIAKVSGIEGETYSPRAEVDQGAVQILGEEVDNTYMDRLETLILNRELVREAKDLKIVFTPLHGTGSVIIKPMLERLGFAFSIVEEQDRFDGNFPTVASPNPENAAALKLGVELAQEIGADLVVATDPDCDRMGVAVRAGEGDEMKLLTGNQIGSLLAYYRIKTLFDRGVLNAENASRAVIIKTFVTTDLQKAIAEKYGLRCVETLTGFKYIGAKLAKYQLGIPEELRENYVVLPEERTRELRLKHSSLYVFGGEESYGYSGGDFVRDKDGNGAAIMFCEVAAYAKSKELTVAALLDQIFAEFGYFEEYNGALTFEGAEGAETIKRLLASYVAHPPGEMLGSKVVGLKNFETQTFRDVEGDEIPKEKMLIFELEDRTRIAVRGSGTEPKIKYYLFGEQRPAGSGFSAAELGAIKQKVGARLRELWEWLRSDAQERARG
ncbi:MAG TPA: phospho-sugar mutase [Chthoniobacterales bacterium]|jgi:phosphoglucomutase|nr:phospho-sugar mutase [Chthoniobacterales bacterium]